MSVWGCIRAGVQGAGDDSKRVQRKVMETESKSEAHGESEKKMERGVKVIGKVG